MSDPYFPPFPNSRRTISRTIAGKRIHLVQDSSLDSQEDIKAIFWALQIPPSKAMIDLYFPVLGTKGRCPTLALLELFSTIDRLVRDKQKEIGV